MLASNQGKAATMRTASSTSGQTRKSSTGTLSTWSRNARFSLRIPLVGRQIHISSQRACRQVESVLYMPSMLYRSFYELEREVCSAIFGALYEQGEKTSFAMSTEIELLYHVRDGQSGYLSPKCERYILDEDNWEEGLERVLSGEAKKVELRATWHRSKGSGQISKSTSTTQTPSNFPARKEMEPMSASSRSPTRTNSSSTSPRRSETMSTRRSSKSERDNSPVSRTDSGLGEMVEVLK
ncbi:hypothetical protein E4T52_16741 [Aureobasidium sp. EXF-3400]|nr:hypothetical protein E4T51_16024 [Aureobasidium sp. EXF-12344]KAI4768153.1 hypothetical protein E4T52_16741 [Aureobasidium sp. EXF-3400]